jgi:hypothetical protein
MVSLRDLLPEYVMELRAAEPEAVFGYYLAWKKIEFEPAKLFPVFIVVHYAYWVLLMNAAIVNAYVDVSAGLDWEVYNAFIDWLVIILNVGTFLKYWYHLGQPVASSITDMVMLFAPVVGNEITLMKEFKVLSIAFVNAQVVMHGTYVDGQWLVTAQVLPTTFSSSLVPNFVGFASLGFLFKYIICTGRTGRADLAQRRTFLCSHWPVVASELKALEPLDAQGGIAASGRYTF